MDASLEWCSTPPLWHTKAVGGVHPIRPLSAVIRFGRAKGRCERYLRPHGRVVLHLRDGRWWDTEADTWRNGRGKALKGLPRADRWPPYLAIYKMRVFLACAHADHDPTNNRPR